MKVMCIKEDTNTVTGTSCDTLLKVGEVYNVDFIETWKNERWYNLAEIKFYKGELTSFWEGLFAPLSDIDETEFIRNKKEELV